MHEIAIAQNIVDIVEQELVRHGVMELRAVNVAVGKLAGVVPEQLAFCFDLITAETSMNGVSLNIREVPMGYVCSSCGEEFTSEEITFVCPRCGGQNPGMITGMELNIESIEVAD
ncbi:MAG: hydrogenase maturation nickel metallochaperone HypA [Dehalococcoidales bacterium]|nr:MAG: hydrogenase maturation nickel metallochaperone HypA [Dehalococcoidales bacterium]